MESLRERLGSRKLWLAVAAFIVAVAHGSYTLASQIVMTYLGVQGLSDAAVRLKRPRPRKS